MSARRTRPGTTALLSRAFLAAHPAAAARILERHPAPQVARLLAQQTPETLAAVVRETLPVIAAGHLDHLDGETVSALVRRLEAQHAARLLRHMEPARREDVLRALPSSIGEAYQRLLRYPPDCAGAHMNPFVLVLPEDLTVTEAMQRVRQRQSGVFYYPYVVDREQRLVGILTVQDVMLAGPKQRLSECMHRDVMRVADLATADDIARTAGRRAYQSMPVVDAQGVLAGVLQQDALKRMEARAQVTLPTPHLVNGLVTVSELYLRTLTMLVPLLGAATDRAIRLRPVEGRRHAG